MSWKLLGPVAASVVLSVAIAGCTSTTVVHTAPPPDRVETVTVAPSAEHFFIRGHWSWDGREWVWTPGRWEVRRAGALWVAGHWRPVSGGWTWEEGRWTVR